MRQVIVAASAALCLTAHAAVAATAPIWPVAGIYLASQYVVAATATNGGFCNHAKGAYYFSTYTYPGPGKAGATGQDALIGPGLGQGYIGKSFFPVTPPVGSTTQSGTYMSQLLPGGIPLPSTFTTTFTITDNNSWTALNMYTYPVGTNQTCTTTIQTVLTRQGK